MLNNRRSKIAIVAIMIFSMLAMYGAIPTVKAASFESAKAILSDATPSQVATTTIIIDMATSLTVNQYIEVDIGPDGATAYGAGSLAGIAAMCPSGTTASTTDTVAMEVYHCVVGGGGFDEATFATTSFGQITIPAYNANGHKITITSRDTDGAEIETSDVIIYPIDDVVVTATVDASLSFSVAGYTGAFNGTTTNRTATATAVPFGTLEVGSTTVGAQLLTVTTNAASGYSVTVQQDGELTSGAGATINNFDNAVDGSGSSTEGIAWNSPDGTLNNDWTYGHFGVTSDDATLDASQFVDEGDADPFDDNEWAGMNGVNPLQVMYHTGPADGTTLGVGTAHVGYAVQISALQEAGDYTANLTYVCTPTY
jgi:hypothetical protein